MGRELEEVFTERLRTML